MASWINKHQGFSLVEVILSVAILILAVTSTLGAFFYAQETSLVSGKRTQALMLAEEGLEVIRNVRDNNFNSLASGNYGLVVVGSQWQLSGTQDIFGLFTRQIIISDINANVKKIESQITWPQTLQRLGSITLTTYLTNWQASIMVTPTTCSQYCQNQGYVQGTCRQNANQCRRNNETYQAGGDQYCLDGPNSDTCCCLP